MNHIDNLIAGGLTRLKPFIMELVCKKCTRVGEFGGANEAEALQRAKRDGWILEDDGHTVVCPRCPIHIDGGGNRIA